MLRIRRIEEAIADEYAKKEMRCPVHLSIGQEAVAVGVCANLTPEDRVFSNHRCHAHYLAKGGDLKAMIAELHGKAGGCCEGKGGSMHLAAPEVGMMGASALVGGTIPLAVGSALASKLAGINRVSVTFFGDGGSEEGIFYESLNFAALKKLPVIFVCENNLYATYSHQSTRQAATGIYGRGKTFGVPGSRVDGNDVEAVWNAAAEAVERARSGGGPTLLECRTYRWRDHVGPADDIEIGYRSAGELASWKRKCPIRKLEKIFGRGPEGEIAGEIGDAFSFARADRFPNAQEIHTHVYANT